ncbi:hypothetical protein A9264_14780 [Vibrio sp. UCD-FRSSP16_10]|uniref:hypothetical protein n=1 Tax=unclassified Vibrio TaxID=2614977 RepID=UPI0007FD51A0|nr:MULTISPECIES: hypothetical protein [unclassified Vibrio]OBT09497.1 hypothetical protein A9260_06665 [Vibrio sp. UCD-FRSSP16_30]OBT19539.1 hypothetical protein A9264_14780 [Vibrio sp. UCD-FRSSP16_10]
MSEPIFYRAGYKYQLAEDFSIQVDILPLQSIKMQFIELSKEGRLSISSGYAWDGPSGPVVDTSNNMRASLVHDAFYQLLRCGKLTADNKDNIDLLFKMLCICDGVDELTAHMYYLGLKLAGKPATEPKNRKPTLQAPWR